MVMMIVTFPTNRDDYTAGSHQFRSDVLLAVSEELVLDSYVLSTSLGIAQRKRRETGEGGGGGGA